MPHIVLFHIFGDEKMRKLSHVRKLWNLMPMDSTLNSVKSNKLPQWEKVFQRFAKNQFTMYELVHEKSGIRKII